MNIHHEQLKFDFRDFEASETPKQGEFTFSTASLSPLITISPRYDVAFYVSGSMVGSLNWESGAMKFEGDAGTSAKIFFDYVIKDYAAWARDNQVTLVTTPIKTL